MLPEFFQLAMISPGRQRAFRWSVVGHSLFLAFALLVVMQDPGPRTWQRLGDSLIGAGIVQGAVLLGWRLVQLPKSQALEFLLVSPLRPARLFLAECLVGAFRFVLVQLAGLPILLLICWQGGLNEVDLLLLLSMPICWGIAGGLSLVVWAYEARWVRRIGQVAAIIGILAYLTLGVLAGERLRIWLEALPSTWSEPILAAFQMLHTYNPFSVMHFWFDGRNGVPAVARERAILVLQLGCILSVALFARGMVRLKGHFHDRHYRPISSERAAQTAQIGDRPLSWWAVRRVMEYSGRSNLWLAGGFSLVYAVFLLAGDSWPTWLGRSVFLIFENLGGAPMLITGLVVLAAVPAAFQYGLWDSTTQDRCRRLELLLLTDLNGRDYWQASLSAAWRRGRGYLVVAGILALALVGSGRASPLQILAAGAAASILWTFAFTIGFGAFSSGMQANGLGSLLTLGLPMFAVLFIRAGLPGLAALSPPGAVYLALNGVPEASWVVGPTLAALATLWLNRRTIPGCVDSLRKWYDRNQGTRAAMT